MKNILFKSPKRLLPKHIVELKGKLSAPQVSKLLPALDENNNYTTFITE